MSIHGNLSIIVPYGVIGGRHGIPGSGKSKMTSTDDNVRTLEWLHGKIEANPAQGAVEAAKTLADDIAAVADKIAEDAEAAISRIHAEAESATVKLTAQVAKSVENVKKDSALAASNLIRDAKGGGNEKENAIAAGKVIKEAEIALAQLNK